MTLEFSFCLFLLSPYQKSIVVLFYSIILMNRHIYVPNVVHHKQPINTYYNLVMACEFNENKYILQLFNVKYCLLYQTHSLYN